MIAHGQIVQVDWEAHITRPNNVLDFEVMETNLDWIESESKC
jgi:hypothetical protein